MRTSNLIKAAQALSKAADQTRDPARKKELRQHQRALELTAKLQARKEGSSGPAQKDSPSS